MRLAPELPPAATSASVPATSPNDPAAKTVAAAPPRSNSGPGATRADGFQRADGAGRKAAHSAEVLALAARYVPRDELGRPMARLMTWAAKLDAIVSGASGLDAVIDTMVAKDARRQVFLLEGLLRLYTERYGKPVEQALERAKQLEDVLGAYVDTRKMTALARDKKCPLPVVETLAKAERKARKELAEVVERHWLPRNGDARLPALAQMLESFTEIKWDGYADDRRYLQGELDRQLRQVQKTKYDMHELQEGIHELRRQLRWIPIYAEALDGLVVIDPKLASIPEYEDLARHELAKSKFVQLPPPTYERAPIAFPLTLYVATVRYVLALGDLKDRGEWIEGLADAYRKSDVVDSRKRAHKAAVEAFGASDENVITDAKKLYRELRDLEYLKRVRRVLTA